MGVKITVRDAARVLGVSEKTIYRWIDERELPVHRVHGQYRFNRAELLEWATRNGRARLGRALSRAFRGRGAARRRWRARSRPAGSTSLKDGADRESVLRAGRPRAEPARRGRPRVPLRGAARAREPRLDRGRRRASRSRTCAIPSCCTCGPAVALCFLEQADPVRRARREAGRDPVRDRGADQPHAPAAALAALRRAARRRLPRRAPSGAPAGRDHGRAAARRERASRTPGRAPTRA